MKTDGLETHRKGREGGREGGTKKIISYLCQQPEIVLNELG